MAQERLSRRHPEREGTPGAGPPPPGAAAGSIAKIDDLLDEIDSVLEENAEEFVKNYVQKGGE